MTKLKRELLHLILLLGSVSYRCKNGEAQEHHAQTGKEEERKENRYGIQEHQEIVGCREHIHTTAMVLIESHNSCD